LDVGTTTYRIAGAYSLEYNERVLSLIRNLFLLAVPLLMLFAAIGGWFIADRGLKPLGAMASRAAEISTKTLHERLPVDGGAELVKLSTVVNSLLDRIEHSFDEQRRFVADASHELRTPAAIVRTETEVTLAREHREEAEYRESFAIVRDATQRLTRIVDDLFMLARSDAGGIVPRRDVVYLDELMEDTVRAVRSVAEKRGVRVVITRMDDATVAGDADLRGRLILYLVDYAIKYSPNGSTVETAITRGGSDVRLEVTDQGPGIPEEARARIFERFFRVDTARSRDHAVSGHTSGAGLGLAIARRIAEMHEGTLELAESRPGRTRFTFVMPLSSRA
jgi:heavy metal sensor kinase